MTARARHVDISGRATRLEIDADYPARPATDAQAVAAISGDVNAATIDREPLRVVAGVESRQPDASHDRRRIGHRADRFRAVTRCNTDRRWRGFRRGNDWLRGIPPGQQRRGGDSQPAPPHRPLGRIGLSPRGRRSVAAKVRRVHHLPGDDIEDPALSTVPTAHQSRVEIRPSPCLRASRSNSPSLTRSIPTKNRILTLDRRSCAQNRKNAFPATSGSTRAAEASASFEGRFDDGVAGEARGDRVEKGESPGRTAGYSVRPR